MEANFEQQIKIIGIGDKIPELKINVYDPVDKKFKNIDIYKEILNKGKFLVLFYYPADFTFVCPTELEDLANKYEEIKKENAEVISMSTDTVYTHLAWHATEKLLENIKYPMGEDHNGNIAKMLNVYEYSSGVSYRATIIIDPDGKIVGIEVNSNDVGRDADELLRKIRAFKYVRSHPGEVCPAKWGKDNNIVLKPGENLVGKVYEYYKKK
ncbi:peroxiredoxin [Nanobdella aerobiophila]|uniref:Peroxiredoxin n=1 Tax=Nanobdella aerobiophila TaxID=2586965 RepID=A0A915S9W4_9ARCH|nr:redoxin domain-containing protein [Nanobdella aerobiophila]BBL45322.1 peroxiredoxin [Nanobdella aerobiophila]